MLKGKELILATKPFAKEIRWKSWFYTLTAFIFLIASLLGTYFVPTIYGKIISSICSAIFLTRFFMIFHDYQHHSILQKSYLANFIFTIYGIYMLTPPSIWKRSHDFHHNNNAKLFSANIGSFPIMTKQKFMESSKSERRIYLAIRHPFNMIFAYLTMFIYGMCIQSFISSPKRHWDSLATLIIHIGIAVTLFIYAGPLTWFLAFFLPFFISHMIGAYLFYAQHTFPGVIFKSNEEWTYANAALDSSSFLKMNPILTWITANIGYHHIHHLNARIPFYRLPETMKSIKELQEAKITSFKLSDIISCLRLKLWDSDQNRMIALSELNLSK
jgi:omega-6 fatty acid desaturase (delta-12 desaturase)